ncbi:MAG: 2'-5' RNA ligase family protein [Actinomycetota bacterium]
MLQDGLTGLALIVPEAEPIVSAWHDPVAIAGRMPAHVTVLYPFVPLPVLTEQDCRALSELAAAHEPVQLTLAEVGRFPEVLWLAPEPAGVVRELSAAVVNRWPTYPPYGGEFGSETIPHLTVARGLGPAEVQQAVDRIERQLPLSATVAALTLMASRAGRWQVHQRFPFG